MVGDSRPWWRSWWGSFLSHHAHKNFWWTHRFACWSWSPWYRWWKHLAELGVATWGAWKNTWAQCSFACFRCRTFGPNCWDRRHSWLWLADACTWDWARNEQFLHNSNFAWKWFAVAPWFEITAVQTSHFGHTWPPLDFAWCRWNWVSCVSWLNGSSVGTNQQWTFDLAYEATFKPHRS